MLRNLLTILIGPRNGYVWPEPFFFFFLLIVDRVTSEGPETQKCLPMIVWPG